MKQTAVAVLAVLVLAYGAHADGKAVFHYVSIPIIEGTGIYASVASLVDDDASVSTQAASITNLGLMATQGTLGMLAAFMSDEAGVKLRAAHRVIGFVITGASVWLAASATVDEAPVARQVGAYGYAAMTTVPLVTFRF